MALSPAMQKLLNLAPATDTRVSRFCELIELYIRDPTLTYEAHVELYAITGKLWNDSRFLNRLVREDLIDLGLEDWQACTYAQAARFVRGHMKANKPRIRVPALFQAA